ncbi:MAG: hypothetical protein ACLP36_08665 [Acidimicrobiales bacterium]
MRGRILVVEELGIAGRLPVGGDDPGEHIGVRFVLIQVAECPREDGVLGRQAGLERRCAGTRRTGQAPHVPRRRPLLTSGLGQVRFGHRRS